MVTALRAEGNSILILSAIQGEAQPLASWNAWNLHLYVVLTLALVLTAPRRGAGERLRLAAVSLAVAGLVSLLIAATQVESAADAQATLAAGVRLYSARHLARLGLASQALITAGMLLLPACLFFVAYLGPGDPPGKATSSVAGRAWPKATTSRRRPIAWGALLAGGVIAATAVALAWARPPGPTEIHASLERLQRINPASPRPHLGLGVWHEDAGRLDDAAAEYKTAQALDPSLAGARYGLGNVYYKQGALDGAAEAYREALRLDPSHTAARQNLGIALYERGRYDEAVPVFSEALRLDPRDAAAHHDLGVSLLKLDRGCEALPHLRQSAGLDGRYASDMALRATIARLEPACHAR